MRYLSAALWGALGAIVSVYVMASVYGAVYERTHPVSAPDPPAAANLNPEGTQGFTVIVGEEVEQSYTIGPAFILPSAMLGFAGAAYLAARKTTTSKSN